jgi:hypothetical protein
MVIKEYSFHIADSLEITLQKIGKYKGNEY